MIRSSIHGDLLNDTLVKVMGICSDFSHLERLAWGKGYTWQVLGTYHEKAAQLKQKWLFCRPG